LTKNFAHAIVHPKKKWGQFGVVRERKGGGEGSERRKKPGEAEVREGGGSKDGSFELAGNYGNSKKERYPSSRLSRSKKRGNRVAYTPREQKKEKLRKKRENPI